jgi:hypothetical protein
VADGSTEVTRLVTEFDANFDKLNAKMDAVIRAQYGAAQKISDNWKRAQAQQTDVQAMTQAATLRSIQLENQLAIARAKGDKSAVQGLTDQLRIQQQIAQLERRGVSPDQAKTQAIANVFALSNAERQAAKAREESDASAQARTLRSIELDGELQVARIAGDKARIKALQEELLIEQQLAKLNAIGITGPAAVSRARSQAAALAAAEVSAEEASFGRAIDKVFDSSKLAVLDEGAAHLRIFGSALEPLGAYGLAAAGAVVAFGVAMEETKKAVEFADNLYRSAQAAHVTTDELQIMREALARAGGEAQQADGALIEFSTTLGKAQTGLKRSERGFTALGFTAEDIKGFKDSGAALDAVVAKIQNLKRPSDQDAAIDLLGLRGLAPLIRQGAEAWKEYREEAAKSVLPAEIIARGHEISVQIDELTRKIKNDLAEAFINLGPILEGLVSLVAKITGGVKVFTDQLAAWARDPVVQAFIDTSTMGVVSGDAVKRFGDSAISEKAGPPPSLETLQGLLKTYFTPKTGKLTDLTPKGSDQTLEFDKKAQDAYDSNLHALAQAQAALITGIHDHAAAEQAAVDDQLRKTIHDLTAQEAEIKKAKNDAHKAEQLSAIEAAKIEAQMAAEDKKALIARQAQTAALQEVIKTRDAVQAQQSRIAGNDAAMTPIREQRNAIDRQRLLDEQKLQLKDFDAETENERAGKSGDDLDLYLRNRGKERGAIVTGQQSDVARQAYDAAGPIEQYARSLQDVNTQLQDDAVEGVKSFSQGLAQAALNAKNAGQIIENVFLNLAEKILEQQIDREAANILATVAHFIPGFADGTSSAPGGVALVGERGPELVTLPRGSKVAPNFQTRAMLSDLGSPAQARAPVIMQQLHLNLKDAMTTREFMAAVNDYADRSAASAGQWARSGAAQDVQGAGYLANINQ